MSFKPYNFEFSAPSGGCLPHQLLNDHVSKVYFQEIGSLRAPQDIATLVSEGAPIEASEETIRLANSKTLHELYFETVQAGPRAMTPAMELGLVANFGSSANWQAEFTRLATAVLPSEGWIVLTFDSRLGILRNGVVSGGYHEIGTVPVLALDLYRHAYEAVYQDRHQDYVRDYLSSIDWEVVYKRYRQAVHSATEDMGVDPTSDEDALFLDVRRLGAYREASTVIPGSIWYDPAVVGMWADKVPRGRKIVCYCVSGYEVCRATILRLREEGIDAHYLRGGIKGWETAGRELQPKD